MRILVIEDEKSLSELIVKRLKNDGYSVDFALDGEEGLHYVKMASYDVILLDLMLPKIDGISVLKRIRSAKIVAPVLILTAKDSVLDKVNGLDAGADDYMSKPFSLEELSARVRALLRRQSESKESVLSECNLELDTLKRIVTRDGMEIRMTSKEFAILEYLLRNKGRVLTREQIAEHAWNFDFDCDLNIINVYIRYLRSKIDEDFEPKLLHTIRGSGYVLKWRK